jgi:hypothetical protein
MIRRSLLVFAFALAAACSGSSHSAKYPRRAPGCPLEMYNGLPQLKLWDDIGPVEVGCYLDESEVACLSRLRTEACRMGGDIVYNVPKKALRPIERGMIYRAMVAHTREAKKADETPAPVDAGSGAVEPLLPTAPAAAAPKPAATDGGGQ